MTVRSSLGLYLHGGGKLGDHQVSSSMLHCNKIIVESLLLFLSVFSLYPFKSRLSLIVRVNIVLNRTVVVDSD